MHDMLKNWVLTSAADEDERQLLRVGITALKSVLSMSRILSRFLWLDSGTISAGAQEEASPFHATLHHQRFHIDESHHQSCNIDPAECTTCGPVLIQILNNSIVRRDVETAPFQVHFSNPELDTRRA